MVWAFGELEDSSLAWGSVPDFVASVHFLCKGMPVPAPGVGRTEVVAKKDVLPDAARDAVGCGPAPGFAGSCRQIGGYIGYTWLSPSCQKLQTSGIEKRGGKFRHFRSAHGLFQLGYPFPAEIRPQSPQKGLLLLINAALTGKTGELLHHGQVNLRH